MAAQAMQLLLACNQQSGVVNNRAAEVTDELSQKHHVVYPTTKLSRFCEALPRKPLTEGQEHPQYLNVCFPALGRDFACKTNCPRWVMIYLRRWMLTARTTMCSHTACPHCRRLSYGCHICIESSKSPGLRRLPLLFLLPPPLHQICRSSSVFVQGGWSS